MKSNGYSGLDNSIIKDLEHSTHYFSVADAMLIFTNDLFKKNKRSIREYARWWRWSQRKVKRFITEIQTPDGWKKTKKAAPIHLIGAGLSVVKQHKTQKSSTEKLVSIDSQHTSGARF